MHAARNRRCSALVLIRNTRSIGSISDRPNTRNDRYGDHRCSRCGNLLQEILAKHEESTEKRAAGTENA